MTDYIPETEEIISAYTWAVDGDDADERAAEARRWLAAHDRKIAAEVLREFAVEVAGELAATKAEGIDLGSDYLHGMRSALMQATDRADRIEQGGES